MAAWQPLRSVLHPVLLLSQAIPIFALAPILTLWLGYGFWSKVTMALLIIYFPRHLVLLRRPHADAARLAGAGAATRRQAGAHHALHPHSRRPTRARLRPAACGGLAPVGAIIGEWVGASQGLGYLMLFANGRAKIDMMFAALAVLLVVTLALRWSTESSAAPCCSGR